jgi:hypothetical protein
MIRLPELENGGRFELFPGASHAKPIEPDMLDGTVITFGMLQDLSKEYEFGRGTPALIFNEVFKYMLKKAEQESGQPRAFNQYGKYINLAESFSHHRPQLMLADYAFLLVTDNFYKQFPEDVVVPQKILLADSMLDQLGHTDRVRVYADKEPIVDYRSYNHKKVSRTSSYT